MKYVVLRAVEPPYICYLWEAVNWRAFGVFPTASWVDLGKDYREHCEDPEMFSPPFPDDSGDTTYLSEAQTEFAGLPPDPSYLSLMNEGEDLSLDHYDRMIKLVQDSENFGPEDVAKEIRKRDQAAKFWSDYEEWQTLYRAYVDQFETELLLALRKGDIVAHGRKLPSRDRDECERKFDELGYYTEEIEPEQIAKEAWVSTHVNWRESSLTSPKTAYVWISVSVDDLLRIFPPTDLISKEKILPIGDTFAIEERAISRPTSSGLAKRGRPSLPWEDFYVELARLYRDGQMPSKKEAAIQHFQTWFEDSQGIKASRSAIGQKLKPFFDRLSEA